MYAISELDIERRADRDNPWWTDENVEVVDPRFPKRIYYRSFSALALNFEVRRAAVLLGPRRVGKTVMIRQMIAEAIGRGFPRQNILYASIDAPIYAGYPLERYLKFFKSFSNSDRYIVVFDEIQYLKDWEIHLKDLVDTYPNIKFVVTGSAAAALRLKSKESGAGRFSEFMLPPLTFYEYQEFLGIENKYVRSSGHNSYVVNDIEALNRTFVDYLNYGGYPEAVLNDHVRSNAEQYIRNDIIDKVLLKDLPSLYGINEIQELNRLFSFLAYNAGNEASLEKISQASGLAKPTIKRYIEYLESAFLIIKLQTMDENCRSLQRERNFKIYLNNPSMRAALFGPIDYTDTDRIGHLAESAVFSQFQHSPAARRLRYARWKNEGEVDLVFLTQEDERPHWIGEIKWSDRIKSDLRQQTRHLIAFARKHRSLRALLFTSKTISTKVDVDEFSISIVPTALYCYALGMKVATDLEQASNLVEPG
ncbi:ATP-binding protein [Prosthecomicrobium sp. N25]|uniref:ATP-binding protein n=1 Tax=Prosthecomicrobium sp. N25 TaxID=3129254 RepID=UPI0030771314